MKQTIRVVLIEEQSIFRAGMRATLERQGTCCIVGEASDKEAVLKLLRTHDPAPDVALLAAELSRADPLEVVCQLRHALPHLAVVLLTDSESEEQLFSALMVGVTAYCPRAITPDALMDIVGRVSQGEFLITDEILAKLHLATHLCPFWGEESVEKHVSATRLPPPSPLTGREVEILACIAGGNSNKAIAQGLQMSDQTVKKSITTIFTKLSVSDRTMAVMTALRHGWIPLA